MWKFKGHRHGRTCARGKWDYVVNQVNGVKSISHPFYRRKTGFLGTQMLEEKCWEHLQLNSMTAWLLTNKITKKEIVDKPSSAILKLPKEHTQSIQLFR